jgi:hypothetical protein
MGWKKLYLFNKKGSRTEAMVYCLLDFYIHETRQRHGYGIKLMDYMLKVLKFQKYFPFIPIYLCFYTALG